jgi:uncharacterized membrane protein HdeD (DUF308 family)
MAVHHHIAGPRERIRMFLRQRALRRLADNWWLLVLRGVLAIIFGIVAWVWPGLTLTTLIILVGAWLLVDGVFQVVSAVINRDRVDSVWPFVIAGVISVIGGIVVLAWPGLSAVALMYLIGAWAVVTGVFEIVAAIQLRREIENEWAIGIGGLISIIFGAIVLIFPGSGAVALVWVIGIYAILIGIALILAGFRLRSWRNSLRD